MLEYLDSNLLTLNKNLLKTNFDRILASIWKETLEEFKEVMDTEEMVSTCRSCVFSFFLFFLLLFSFLLYIALFSVLEQTHCARMRFYMSD